MFYSLALIAVSVLALVSAKTSDDPSRNWKPIGTEKHEKCKAYLDHIGEVQSDKLKELLETHSCSIVYMQCKDAFMNPSVNTQLYGAEVQTLSEAENTYVVEVLCYREAGKPTYTNKTTGDIKSSFLTLVADSESGLVLDDKLETIKFYSEFAKIEEADPIFGKFYVRYSGFDRVMSNFGLVLLVSLFGRFLF